MIFREGPMKSCLKVALLMMLAGCSHASPTTGREGNVHLDFVCGTYGYSFGDVVKLGEKRISSSNTVLVIRNGKSEEYLNALVEGSEMRFVAEEIDACGDPRSTPLACVQAGGRAYLFYRDMTPNESCTRIDDEKR